MRVDHLRHGWTPVCCSAIPLVSAAGKAGDPCADRPVVPRKFPTARFCLRERNCLP